jgi:hypothetical protein
MLEQSRAQIFGSQLGGPFLGRIFLPGRPHLGNASCQLALGKEQQSRMGVSRAYELFSIARSKYGSTSIQGAVESWS